MRHVAADQLIYVHKFDKLAADAQSDNALPDSYGFALHIALAQVQKFAGVKPEGGVYMVRDSRLISFPPFDCLFCIVKDVLSELILSTGGLCHGSSPRRDCHDISKW